MIGTFVVQFLLRNRRHLRARKQTRLGATSIDTMFTEESEEDKVVEQHFVEAQTTHKDTWEENIVEAEVQPSTEVQVEK
jgi:hypothetical protein